MGKREGKLKSTGFSQRASSAFPGTRSVTFSQTAPRPFSSSFRHSIADGTMNSRRVSETPVTERYVVPPVVEYAPRPRVLPSSLTLPNAPAFLPPVLPTADDLPPPFPTKLPDKKALAARAAAAAAAAAAPTTPATGAAPSSPPEASPDLSASSPAASPPSQATAPEMTPLARPWTARSNLSVSEAARRKATLFQPRNLIKDHPLQAARSGITPDIAAQLVVARSSDPGVPALSPFATPTLNIPLTARTAAGCTHPPGESRRLRPGWSPHGRTWAPPGWSHPCRPPLSSFVHYDMVDARELTEDDRWHRRARGTEDNHLTEGGGDGDGARELEHSMRSWALHRARIEEEIARRHESACYGSLEGTDKHVYRAHTPGRFHKPPSEGGDGSTSRPGTAASQGPGSPGRFIGTTPLATPHTPLGTGRSLNLLKSGAPASERGSVAVILPPQFADDPEVNPPLVDVSADSEWSSASDDDILPPQLRGPPPAAQPEGAAGPEEDRPPPSPPMTPKQTPGRPRPPLHPEPSPNTLRSAYSPHATRKIPQSMPLTPETRPRLPIKANVLLSPYADEATRVRAGSLPSPQHQLVLQQQSVLASASARHFTPATAATGAAGRAPLPPAGSPEPGAGGEEPHEDMTLGRPDALTGALVDDVPAPDRWRAECAAIAEQHERLQRHLPPGSPMKGRRISSAVLERAFMVPALGALTAVDPTQLSLPNPMTGARVDVVYQTASEAAKKKKKGKKSGKGSKKGKKKG
ncbi:hypothetical protein PAPYR_4671 [Paratrimastix pyriformis]|uniref:Uncharacterized protein n=1 Tax=Paratrimastix pyriformis TaxID=342808 RepID=A0ABQ8UJG6_9EUKA|nr:hypothetical protein PAPYR_4671 [Paratrimastix pyriformis]